MTIYVLHNIQFGSTIWWRIVGHNLVDNSGGPTIHGVMDMMGWDKMGWDMMGWDKIGWDMMGWDMMG